MSGSHTEFAVKVVTPVRRINASEAPDGLDGRYNRWKYECEDGEPVSIAHDSVIFACDISDRSNGELEVTAEDGTNAKARLRRWEAAGKPCGTAPSRRLTPAKPPSAAQSLRIRSRRGGGIVWPHPTTCTCPKDKDCWWASTGQCPQ